jgi:antitoxin MazE
MVQAVLKWGNSLALRIPAAIARQMEIEEGAEIKVRVEGRRLVVEKAEQLPEFSHSDLLRALSQAQKQLVDFGPPRGNEVL